MKKKILLTSLLLSIFITGCGHASSETVIIYSSSEDYRNEYYSKKLNQHFPNYNITIEYLPSGNNAAKLKAEDLDTECDIVMGLDYAYLDLLKDNLAVLTGLDNSLLTDDVIDEGNRYFPELRSSGCIIINTDTMKENNLDEPQSYNDLLNSEYSGYITMPNPKTSGTGYMFLKSLVNKWGEDEAFSYFDQLSSNVLQFTASGSGPINSLMQGESAIGFGMTAQAVTEINKGAPFKLLFFDNSAPYSLCGYGIIKGKESNPAVMDVFQYFYNDLIHDNNKLFFPETIYKTGPCTIENYPTGFEYADMSKNSITERERLLQKWMY